MKILTNQSIHVFVNHLSNKGVSSSEALFRISAALSFITWLSSTKSISDSDAARFRAELYKAKHELSRQKALPMNFPLKYVGFSLAVLSLLLVGGGLYLRFYKSVKTPFAFTTAPVRAGRAISFQGRLTDTLGNPITAPIDVTYKFYNVSTGGSVLTDATRVCTANPDQDGVFYSLIGNDAGGTGATLCNVEVPNAVFTENTDVYLGVTIGTEITEMSPRQQIANVGYAINSETLQGMPPGSDVSNVPFINTDGNMLIAASNPGIRSISSSNFTISSALATTIQSAGSGDITLDATAGGSLRFKVYNGTPLEAMTILNTGRVGIGTTAPRALLDVAGDATVSGSLIAGGQIKIGDFNAAPVNVGNGSLYYDNATNKVYFWNATAWTEMGAGATQYWQQTLGSLAPTNITDDLNLGAVATGSAIVHLPGLTNQNAFFNLGTGNVGIGTTTPTALLHLKNGNLMYEDNVNTKTVQIGKDGSSYGLFGVTDQATGDTALTQMVISAANNNISNSGLIKINGGSFGITLQGGGWNSGGDISLSTWNGTPASAADTVRLIVKHTSGNIGIGTTTPTAKLDVNGNLNVSTYATVGASLALGTSSAAAGPGHLNMSGDLTLGGALKPGGNAGTNGYLLTSSAGGVNTWTDPTTLAGINYWQRTLGSLAPINVTDSLNLGSIASSSALVHLAGTAGENSWINTGNVGIGTTNPSQKLDVSGYITASGRVNTADAFTIGGAQIADFSGSTLRIAPHGFWTQLALYSNGSERMRLDTSGNVGIGTTAPTATLDIAGDASTSGHLVMRGTTPDYLHILNGADFRISTSPGGDVGDVDRLSILANGNVGIGTTNPIRQFNINQVTGSAKGLIITGDEYYQTGNGTPDQGIVLLAGVNRSGNRQLWIGDNADLGSATQAMFRYRTGAFASLDAVSGNGVNIQPVNIGSLTGSVGIGFNDFSTLPGSKLSINGNLSIGSSYKGVAAPADGLIVQGNVGIGTIAPGAKLDVNGNLNVSTYATISASLALGTSSAAAGPGNLNMSGNLTITGAIKPGGVAGANGYLLTSSAGGVNTWTNPTTLAGVNYWQRTLGSLAPANITDSLNLGGVGTSSALVHLAGTSGENSFFNTGNVGIGTTTPTVALQVNGQIYANNSIITAGAGGGIGIVSRGGVGSNYQWYNQTGVDLRLHNGLADIFTIQDGGNVGIGTVVPGNLLQINSGAAPSTSQVRITANDAGSLSLINYAAGNSQIRFDADYSGGVWIARNTSAAGIVEDNGTLMFDTNTGLSNGVGFTPTTRMVINTSGNVGIGTTTPGAKLDVNGNLNVSTYASVSASLALGTSSAAAGPGNLDMSGNLTIAGAIKPGGVVGTNGFLLTSSAGGVNTWTDPASIGGGSNVWQRTLGSLAPINITDSLNLGGVSTASALVHLAGTTGENSWINTGKVGIGTTAPQLYSAFEVNTSGSMALYTMDSVSGGLLVGYNGPTIQGRTAAHANSDLLLNVYGGNVGIGTPTPTAKLDVSGNLNVSTYATVGASLALGTSSAAAGPGNLNMSGNLTVGNAYVAGVNGVGVSGYLLTSSAGGVNTWTNPASIGGGSNLWQRTLGSLAPINITDSLNLGSTASSSALVHLAGTSGENSFFNTGNVGIGTNNPINKLHIAGGLGGLFYTTTDYATGVSGSGLQIAEGANTGNTYSQMQSYIAGALAYGNLVLQPNGGNVGIGTTTPDSALDVFRSHTWASNDGLTRSSINNYSIAASAVDQSGYVTGIKNVQYLFPNSGITYTNTLGIYNEFGIAGGTGGTVTNARGFATAPVSVVTGGTIVNSSSFQALTPWTNSGMGSITNTIGFHAQNQGGAGITNAVGLYVDAQSGASGTNYAAIFAGGNVGIGTTSPYGKLEISKDTSTVTGETDYALRISEPTVDTALLFGVSAANNTGIIQSLAPGVSWSSRAISLNPNGGNIGVGTLAPNFLLSLGTSLGDKIALYDGGAGNNYGLGIQSALMQLYTIDSASDITFGYGNSSTMTRNVTFKGAGNVGIGTTAPGTLLQLGTAGTTAGTLSLAGGTSGLVTLQTAAAAGTWSLTLPSSAGTLGYVLSTDGSGVTSWYDVASAISSSVSSSAHWQRTLGSLAPVNITDSLNLGATATSSALVHLAGTTGENSWIKTGNFGIGTTNPTAKLEVVGNIIGDEFCDGATAYCINPANGGPAATNLAGGITMIEGLSAKFASLSENVTVGTDMSVRALTGKLFLDYWDTGTSTFKEGLTLKDDGSVGIGTTAPDRKLHVAGDVQFNGDLFLNGGDSGLAGQVLTSSGGAGSNTWSDILSTTGGKNQWQELLGALSPLNSTLDILIGGQASSSAKFAFMNVNSGTPQMRIGGTPSIYTGYELEVGGRVLADAFFDAGNPNYYINPATGGTSAKLQGTIELEGNISMLSATPTITSYDGAAYHSIILKGSSNTTSTSVCIDGTGTCDGKLDVGTVDPPYTINGKKYATYLPSMTGVKEETTGNVVLSAKSNTVNGYEYTIDFNSQTAGSDLWLFAKTTALRNRLSKMSVLMSPSENARTWYKIDEARHTLTLYASRPTTLSYRLTAPRFDDVEWKNETSPDSSGGFIINDPDISIDGNGNLTGQLVAAGGTDGATQLLDEMGVAYDKIVTGILSAQKIISPIIETESLKASKSVETPLVKTNEINITALPGQLAALVIKGLNDTPVAQIDTLGNATFAGTLTAQTVNSQQLTANSLNTNNASVSGTLIAKNIQSDTIDSLSSQIASASSTVAANDQRLTTDINAVQAELAALKNQPLPNPAYYQNMDASYGNLTVNNTANIYKATIADSLLVGTLYVAPSSILALSSDLRISSLGTIRLFDDAVVIAKNGDMTMKGEISATSLAIKNTDGVTVASIDASGSAHFNEVIARKFTLENIATQGAFIADSGIKNAENISIPAISTTTEAAGIGVVPADTKEIIIYNKNVTENSLIYLTPTTENMQGQLSVTKKISCDNRATTGVAPTGCSPYFIVSSTSAIHSASSFNWLIIN